jgi:hypothetical protein
MLHYTPVKNFMKAYPKVEYEFIHASVKHFVENEKDFVEKYQLLLSTITKEEIIELKEELRIIVKSFAKEVDLPGERGLIEFKMEQLFLK